NPIADASKILNFDAKKLSSGNANGRARVQSSTAGSVPQKMPGPFACMTHARPGGVNERAERHEFTQRSAKRINPTCSRRLILVGMVPSSGRDGSQARCRSENPLTWP